MQTKMQSFKETVSQTALGYCTSLLTWYCIVLSGYFDMHMSLVDNLTITFVFTAVSLARGFCVRRYYNWLAGVNT